jgi:hypothetical protein
VTFVVGAAAYAWNLRRAPQPVSASGRRRRLAAAAGWLFSGGDSIRRAGFAFALHAIVRSAPHRLAMAGAVALALALSVGLLSKNGFRPTLEPSFPSGYILIVQPVVLTILLAGFRRAVRVPAELRANWIMQMAWRRGERRFLAGVKLAALVGVALPTLAITAANHVLLISEQMAALRFFTGLVYCLALNEALYTGCKKVPLASSYEPLTNVKTIGPIVFLFFLMFMNSFTRVERAALQTTQGITNFVLVLLAVTIVLRGLDYWLTRGERPMKFDEPPEPSTQWLGLTQ